MYPDFFVTYVPGYSTSPRRNLHFLGPNFTGLMLPFITLPLKPS